MAADSTELNPNLLAGRRVLLVGGAGLPDALGGTFERVEDPTSLDDEAAAAAVTEFAARSGGLEAAVIDCASVFGSGPDRGMGAALDLGWRFARAAAVAAMVERGGGTVVLIAPESGGGDAAAAAVADGLENAARGLGVEWARFDIRVVAICPRPGARRTDVAALVALLCSGSGTYLSGCRLEPGG
jgi:NAD(P)-dependent dehydrogenase (short-subunit alcohol dehydrogenase family)